MGTYDDRELLPRNIRVNGVSPGPIEVVKAVLKTRAAQ
jgi:NAD(P)-dependent dehydrogenase (short-subunit alcohol dehydrogenase family)